MSRNSLVLLSSIVLCERTAWASHGNVSHCKVDCEEIFRNYRTTEQGPRFNHEQKSGIKSITVENKPVKITPRKQTMNIVSLCKNNFLP